MSLSPFAGEALFWSMVLSRPARETTFTESRVIFILLQDDTTS